MLARTRKCGQRPANGRSIICCGGLSASDFALIAAASCAGRGRRRRPALQPRRRCRDRAISPADRAWCPSWSPMRTAAMSKPSWSAAKAPSAASSAKAICRPIPASWSNSAARSCGCRSQNWTRRKQNRPSLRNVFARYADCMLAQMFQSTACNAIHSIEQRTAKWIISAMERTDGDEVVPLTHEQLATLLGVGRSYASRVIQTFKAEGCWRPAAARSWSATPMPSGSAPACVMNPSKTTLRKCCAGSIPTEADESREAEAAVWRENQLTKSQTTHCFLAFSDYIAPQRVRCARSFWPGFLFGRV